jgi:hypothetical protein
MGQVGPPNNVNLPFFAYGIFKVGEVAWPRIEKLVRNSSSADLNDWTIGLRNGLPMLIPSHGQQIHGDEVFFEFPQDAYKRIGSTEPKSEYEWREVTTSGGQRCNVLIAKNPTIGMSEELLSNWTSAHDPAFVHGMAYVSNVIANLPADVLENKPWGDDAGDWNAFFELQGAFLVLWSIVERMAAFRFGAEYPSANGEASVSALINALSKESAFQHAMTSANIRSLSVYSVRRNSKQRFESPSTENNGRHAAKVLSTWYQIRSNVTHRGKSARSENMKVVTATIDLFNTTFHYLETVIDGIDVAWSRRGVQLLPQVGQSLCSSSET